MLKFVQKKLKEEKGLTLIELLAVIVILAIIAAIAIPAIGNIMENSRYTAVKSDAINVINAAQLYYTDTASPVTPVTVEILKNDNFLESSGEIPDASTVSANSPHALTTPAGTPIVFSGTKSVTFTGATIQGINDDDTKGSEVDDEDGITIDE
ncbi:Tfp assembly type protein [Bhargavaea cecembensis]|uniref:Tfp assembly type protein n=1 Tax=Bhargavaea cecembensis TaxID=394098 RepID=A0A165HHM7_9BACL|nr:prepilin-type N-terminal cleavage/methylation domain-containing protein [Bhargavaea cecembensis]KZE39998.1 Tfp assembly type protein [Bhargavaea cecembensis]